MPVANVLQPLIDVFEAVLVFIHDTFGFGWGFSIVAMTILIRALLLPLTLKQVKSMRGMQQIAPQMKELRGKHKDDPQRLNQEMMKLYRDNQVNPFASCLPILAQIPVFISLFYLLRDDLRSDICPERQPPEGTVPCGETDVSNFLFIPDITNRATGIVLITLIVLYVGTQLASSLLMTVTADRTQRMIFLALPFLFIPFVWTFPAGLLVYWITTNSWTIVQQFIVRRTVGPMPPPDLSMLTDRGGGKGGDGKAGADGGGRAGPRARAGAGAVSAGANGGANGAPRGRTAPPPPPPRRKKKQRSGRRR
jgi:YidC/Oxa1 family membrane protein insertase